MQIYLLNVKKLIDCSEDKEFLDFVDQRLDAYRLNIVHRKSKNKKGAALARGAGLLLQIAIYRYSQLKSNGIDIFEGENIDKYQEAINIITIDKILSMLESLDKPLDLQYKLNEHEKPFLVEPDSPFFNISHCGDNVILALSENELGIDIQDDRQKDILKLAKNFYSENECIKIERCLEDKDNEQAGIELFYKNWARKEALGKCIGDGVRPVLDLDTSLLDEENIPEYLSRYTWMEYRLDNYYICVCIKK